MVGYMVYSKTGCGKAYERSVGRVPKSTERLWLFQSRGGPNLRASSPRLGCERGWFSSGRPCRALKSPPSPGIQASSDPPTRQTSAVGFTGLGSPRPRLPPLRFELRFRGAQPNSKYPCGPHSAGAESGPLRRYAAAARHAGRGLARLANAGVVGATSCPQRHAAGDIFRAFCRRPPAKETRLAAREDSY